MEYYDRMLKIRKYKSVEEKCESPKAAVFSVTSTWRSPCQGRQFNSFTSCALG